MRGTAGTEEALSSTVARTVTASPITSRARTKRTIEPTVNGLDPGAISTTARAGALAGWHAPDQLGMAVAGSEAVVAPASTTRRATSTA